MTLHTPYPINNYFELNEIVAKTANADLYQALDKSSGKQVLVWQKRTAFELDSVDVEKFVERIKKIDEVEPPVSEIQFFGVDSNGKAFLVYHQLSGSNLEKNIINKIDAERRFISCLNCVSKLHNNGIVCGDLSTTSFWVDRNSDVILTALIGLHNYDSLQNFPAEKIAFLAPELKDVTVKVSNLSFASDVYSLGVIAAEIYGIDLNSFGEINSKLPVWLNDIILKCVSINPNDRFKNATEILKTINNFKLSERNLPSVRSTKSYEHLGKPLVVDEKEADPLSVVKYAVLGFSVIFLIFSGYFIYGQLVKKDRIADKIAILGNQELANSVGKIENESDTNVVESEINKLINSTDPLAHQYLVEQAIQSESKKIRFLSQKALIDRAKSNNLNVTADQVFKYLERTANNPKIEQLSFALKLLDPTLDVINQEKYLTKIKDIDTDLFKRLIIALSIDQSFNRFSPNLLNKISNSFNNNLASIVIADRELSQIFSDKLDLLIDKLTAEDLKGVLTKAADRGDAILPKLVKLAIDKKLVSGIDLEYYKVISNNSQVSPLVLGKIAKAANQDLSLDDIKQIAKWYDSDSEYILLLLLSDEKQTLKGEIFDNYLGRNPRIEPSAKLAVWVNSNLRKERLKFMPLISSLGLKKIKSKDDIEKNFTLINEYLSNPKLIKALLELKNQTILGLILKSYPDSLTLANKIEMLNNPDSNLRILAIQSINTNDVGALKIIGDQFKTEKDENVKAEYRKHFWTLADR